jgi:hypothetical protein
LVLAQKYNKPVVLRVAFEELIVPKKNWTSLFLW